MGFPTNVKVAADLHVCGSFGRIVSLVLASVLHEGASDDEILDSAEKFVEFIEEGDQ